MFSCNFDVKYFVYFINDIITILDIFRRYTLIHNKNHIECYRKYDCSNRLTIL